MNTLLKVLAMGSEESEETIYWFIKKKNPQILLHLLSSSQEKNTFWMENLSVHSPMKNTSLAVISTLLPLIPKSQIPSEKSGKVKKVFGKIETSFDQHFKCTKMLGLVMKI